MSTTAFGVGLVAALTGVLYFVAVPLGLAGLVLGLVAIRRPAAVRRLALGGILLSIVGLVVGLGLAAYLVFGGDDDDGATTVIDGIESGSDDTVNPPQRDLDGATSCIAEDGRLVAEGGLANRSQRVANYQLAVAWELDGHTVAVATAIVEALAPGEEATWNVSTDIDDDVDVPPGAATSCRVIRIDRSTG